MTREHGAEIGERWKGLEQDEYDYYLELGALARDAYESGDIPFRRRKYKHSKPKDLFDDALVALDDDRGGPPAAEEGDQV